MPPAEEGEQGVMGSAPTPAMASDAAPPASTPPDSEAAVQAVLPEDAPPGHEAHTLVRWDQGKWPHAHFTVGVGASKTRFQTTLGHAGSVEVALKIARACFMKFEKGASFDEVKQYREECYARVKQARGESTKKPERRPDPRRKKKVEPTEATAKEEEAVACPPGQTVLDDQGREDAAPGSAAFKAVRFDTCNETYWFRLELGGTTGPKFCVKVPKNGSSADAHRIARLCYLKLEAGGTKEEVYALREQLKATSCPRKNPGAALAAPAATAPATGGNGGCDEIGDGKPATSEVKASKRRERKDSRRERKNAEGVVAKDSKEPKLDGVKDVKDQATIPAQAASDADVFAVLPPELSQVAAKHPLKFKRGRGEYGGLFWFEYMGGGHRERFQTTQWKSGGSKDAAEHLARLCIAQFEAGASRAEVAKFRDELYARCGDGPSRLMETRTAAPRKRQRTSRDQTGKDSTPASLATLDAVREKMRAGGRLEGAVHVTGRERSAKNASINGVYALIKGGFEGKRAYEKADGSTSRVLFYSARKSRWKINETLDDHPCAGTFLRAAARVTTRILLCSV